MRRLLPSSAVLVIAIGLASCGGKPRSGGSADSGTTSGATDSSATSSTDLTSVEDKEGREKLRRIARAMHGFATSSSDGNTLPPQGYGKGKLSWRVMILPQLGYASFFSKFKLDESWDSPTNKPLVDQMPAVYANPKGNAKQGETYIKVFSGGGAWFDPSFGLGSSKLTPQDGASNTILLTEGGDPVIWTKADDIPYDPSKPLPNLTPPDGSHKLNIAMGDGATYTIDLNKVKKNDKNFRAAITAHGGEPFSFEDWNPAER